jgi:hypothetical protein
MNSRSQFLAATLNRGRAASFGAGWCAAVVIAVLLSIVVSAPGASSGPFSRDALAGRWDLKVHDGKLEYPSWLEVRLSGSRTLVGSYVGQFGSARPIAQIDFNTNNGRFNFTVPVQWEKRTNPVVFNGQLQGDSLAGETTNDQGQPVRWQARRAPSLNRSQTPKWGKPIKLFNGRDLTGWKPRHAGTKHGWGVQNGALANLSPGVDLMTEQKFSDFKLHAQFRYPKGSNSGIYLRGRYEVQIEDNFGKEPDSHFIGGVYGFLTPRVNACKPADTWQTLDVTLVGRVLTIVLNGEPIIERQAIPGITGGALDSDEDQPGPILLQGDHGRVEFKELTLTPATP